MSVSLFSDLRYLLVSYRKASLGTRLHVCGRRISCPLDQIIQEIPAEGVHLDVGCGHGALLALMHRRCPKQTLIGIDISTAKIRQANLSGVKNITFRAELIEQFPPNSVDSISIVDVLYLIPLERRKGFLRACAAALRLHGHFLIKETGTRPLWKYAILLLQEFLAVKALRMTQGSVIQIVSEQDMVSLVTQAGFAAPAIKHLDRGYPYPHVYFITRKLNG